MSSSASPSFSPGATVFGDRHVGVRDLRAQLQVAGVDDAARAQRRGALQHVLQLAHVAREVIVAQRVARGVGHLQRPVADLPAEARHDRLDQLVDVLQPLAQRRHADLDDVDAVEQVLAELALGDQRRQVLVGGRQDAHVDREFPGLADRPHALFLDDAQQLDLHVQRQVGDLVQEQRAALGGLDQALLVGDRAGEAALLVAEQLAFHQLGRDRAAVHRHERPVAARAGVVDQVRDQLLAGARLAVDVHRRLAARDALDHLAQLLHGARAAEELDLRQLQRAFSGPAELERRGDQLAQRRHVERLGDEIEGAELERAHRGLDVAVRGDHRDRRLRLVRLDPLDDVQAVAVRQPHVGEAQVEGAGAQLARGRADGVGRGHVEIHALQRDAEELADVRLVVDDERARFGHKDSQR